VTAVPLRRNRDFVLLQIGQLLSRLTTDLGVIRRFISFGLIFLIVNTATYVTVVALLLRLYWPLGLVVGVSAIPLFLFSRKFSRHYLSTSRRQQDQQGDVADLVEESAQGIRTIKSFGRAPHMGRRFERAARTLHDTGVAKAGLLARTWAEFDSVPNVTLAIVLLGGVNALAGPLIGATAFTWLQDVLPRHTEYWRSVFGGIILLLVLAFPMGIGGVAASWFERVRWR